MNDLARAHVQAMDYVTHQPPGFQAMNLGTGRGTSVMELVHEFERASGVRVPVKMAPRGRRGQHVGGSVVGAAGAALEGRTIADGDVRGRVAVAGAQSGAVRREVVVMHHNGT